MNARTRSTSWTVLSGLLLFACGGDSADRPDAAPPAPDAPPAPEAPAADAPADITTDVRQIPFAPALDVALGDMELRESGLYVQVLEEGRGPPADEGDEMGIHYTVWLPSGRKLDSSHDHAPPEPLPMVLGETSLIDGWVEGVTGMRLGERRKLVLPYDLAYGARGRSGVPPYSALVFEVELATHTPRDP